LHRLALLVLGNLYLIVAAASFSVLAHHYHNEYGKAHEAVYRSSRVSPELFYKRAGYSAAAIGLVCLVALIVAIWTKHPISLMSLVFCIGIFVYTMQSVGTRY
jgi:hypothetical protein